MTSIFAQQLIFSRVEPEYSPRNEGGYQTVYASSGIGRDEVAFIEARVSCFQPAKGNTSPRKQFFCLPTGKIVLTHSAPIEIDPIITDKYSRGGAFIAHCLVFTQDLFHHILNNPFDVFRQFRFLASPKEMVSSFDQQKGVEPVCEIQVDAFGGDSLDAVFWKQSPEIFAYAKQVQETKNKPEQLLLLGSPKQIENFLEAVFMLVPSELRLSFSFTTNIDSCQVQAADYWAIGASEIPDGRFRTLQLSNAVSLPFNLVEKSDDLYTGWLLKHKNSITKTYLEITSAQAISFAFQKKQPLEDFITPEVAQDFYTLYQNQIHDALRKAIEGQLSPKLANGLVKFLVTVKSPNYIGLLTIAATGAIHTSLLVKACQQIILKTAPTFGGFQKSEWATLGNFSEKAQDLLLGFWSAAMLQNQKKAQSISEQFSNDQFNLALNLFDKPIHPVYYASKKHAEAFVDAFALIMFQTKDQEFCEVVYAICDVHAANFLTKVSQRISKLENQALTQLEFKLKKVKDLSPEFNQAIKNRRKALGVPTGIAGWFYKEK